MFSKFFRDISGIAKELHMANVINAERNAILERIVRKGFTPSPDVMPLTREYLKQIHATHEVGVSNG